MYNSTIMLNTSFPFSQIERLFLAWKWRRNGTTAQWNNNLKRYQNYYRCGSRSCHAEGHGNNNFLIRGKTTFIRIAKLSFRNSIKNSEENATELLVLDRSFVPIDLFKFENMPNSIRSGWHENISFSYIMLHTWYVKTSISEHNQSSIHLHLTIFFFFWFFLNLKTPIHFCIRVLHLFYE